MRQLRRKNRIRHDRKTNPVTAADKDSGRERIDHGRYFRCWNCDFVCDIERDGLGGEGERHGRTYTAVEDTADIVEAGLQSGDGDLAHIITVDGPNFVSPSLLKTDSNGNAVAIVRNYTPESTGCPLCGTRAWKVQ